VDLHTKEQIRKSRKNFDANNLVYLPLRRLQQIRRSLGMS
jgi:hypothetical protein